MEHTLQKLDSSDLLLAFVNSKEKSEGMLFEIGYAVSKGKQFTLALKNEVTNTSIAQMANLLINFDTLDELCNKLLESDLCPAPPKNEIRKPARRRGLGNECRRNQNPNFLQEN